MLSWLRSHLKQVVEMSSKFKQYMHDTHRASLSRELHVNKVRDGDKKKH
jgi:hypothetical protein